MSKILWSETFKLNTYSCSDSFQEGAAISRLSSDSFNAAEDAAPMLVVESAQEKNSVLKFGVPQDKLASLPFFRFFDPDFYFDGKDWHLVSDISPSYSLELDQLASIKRFSKKSLNLSLVFKSCWLYSFFQVKHFFFEFQDIDVEDLKKQLFEIQEASNNFRVLHYEVVILHESYSIFNRSLSLSNKISLSISILFFADLSLSELITINFEAGGSKYLKYSKNISVPSSKAEVWDEKVHYMIDDFIFYDKNYYQCLVPNLNQVPDLHQQFWKLVEIDISHSFLNSSIGQKAKECFDSNIRFFIEKKIADEVHMVFYDLKHVPAMNQVFRFEGRVYRIIEVLNKWNGLFMQTNIKALESLSIGDIQWPAFNFQDPFFDCFYDLDKKCLVIAAPQNLNKQFAFDSSCLVERLKEGSNENFIQ